jgi:hypothetical protein
LHPQLLLGDDADYRRVSIIISVRCCFQALEKKVELRQNFSGCRQTALAEETPLHAEI